ncbi:acetyl/propionyl/methylcrotonyl-CoA carboxylase subunit alpha [Oenococcus alcoholitolerans]|uniref:acetyl-CoA carboxylase biotin carboxylase subunit n=1 Tax=Oenococcus alcoholitolerans TaxID=931074 RepID=UPI003F709CAA
MKKVLVANRGEIAVRVIRACKVLDLKTVAVYSLADKSALHVQLADQAVCIGPADPKKSYLNQNNIIAAAQITGADAIHPGYGFLSENADFAELCQNNGLTFIGPSASVIRTMGDKEQARQTMQAAGVPIIAGSENDFLDLDTGLKSAAALDYPVMLKASAGGGGKGMRIVASADQFANQFSTAQAEAVNSFGDGHMYLEKYLPDPRHIEVQIAADNFGHVFALGERDCTIQQRHQKVIEEAPATALDDDSRQVMFDISVKAAESIGYVGVGTMEFLYQGPSNFYFMEMNTRLQVEHPVSELTSNHNLVELQLMIANGQRIDYLFKKKSAVENFALECRINALTAGKITSLHLPGGNGIRVDDALYQGYLVPPYYDSMIAKIIAYGKSRSSTIKKMQAALDETVIGGISTNLDFLAQLLREEDYLKNNTDINWLDRLSR